MAVRKSRVGFLTVQRSRNGQAGRCSYPMPITSYSLNVIICTGLGEVIIGGVSIGTSIIPRWNNDQRSDLMLFDNFLSIF